MDAPGLLRSAFGKIGIVRHTIRHPGSPSLSLRQRAVSCASSYDGQTPRGGWVMSNLFSAEMRRDPYPIYEQLRDRSPVLYYEPLDVWMIFDYEGVKWALSDPETFSSRAAPPGS
jgi:cytochrome P450